MVKISNASFEKNSQGRQPFQQGFQRYNFFAIEALLSEKGQPEKLEKMDKTGKSIVMQIREWSILLGNTGLNSLVSKSLHYFGFPAC